MNRSSLKSHPFIAALMAFASGASFGSTKPTPEELERRQKSAAGWMPFVSGCNRIRSNRRSRRHLPVPILRAHRKVERQNRHAAQRRLRTAA